jgi:hypothetical protein
MNWACEAAVWAEEGAWLVGHSICNDARSFARLAKYECTYKKGWNEHESERLCASQP